MDNEKLLYKNDNRKFFGKKFSHKKIGKKLPRKEHITEKDNTRKK